MLGPPLPPPGLGHSGSSSARCTFYTVFSAIQWLWYIGISPGLGIGVASSGNCPPPRPASSPPPLFLSCAGSRRDAGGCTWCSLLLASRRVVRRAGRVIGAAGLGQRRGWSRGSGVRLSCWGTSCLGACGGCWGRATAPLAGPGDGCSHLSPSAPRAELKDVGQLESRRAPRSPPCRATTPACLPPTLTPPSDDTASLQRYCHPRSHAWRRHNRGSPAPRMLSTRVLTRACRYDWPSLSRSSTPPMPWALALSAMSFPIVAEASLRVEAGRVGVGSARIGRRGEGRGEGGGGPFPHRLPVDFPSSTSAFLTPFSIVDAEATICLFSCGEDGLWEPRVVTAPGWPGEGVPVREGGTFGGHPWRVLGRETHLGQNPGVRVLIRQEDVEIMRLEPPPHSRNSHERGLSWPREP